MGDRVKLSTVRTDCATIIGTALPNDVGVIDFLPDSIAPPVVLIAWSDPWLKPSTICAYEARMEVLCVAQRIEPGGRLETLEDIVSAILPAMRGSGFTLQEVTSMYPLNIGGNDYLAASLTYIYDVD